MRGRNKGVLELDLTQNQGFMRVQYIAVAFVNINMSFHPYLQFC